MLTKRKRDLSSEKMDIDCCTKLFSFIARGKLHEAKEIISNCKKKYERPEIFWERFKIILETKKQNSLYSSPTFRKKRLKVTCDNDTATVKKKEIKNGTEQEQQQVQQQSRCNLTITAVLSPRNKSHQCLLFLVSQKCPISRWTFYASVLGGNLKTVQLASKCHVQCFELAENSKYISCQPWSLLEASIILGNVEIVDYLFRFFRCFLKTYKLSFALIQHARATGPWYTKKAVLECIRKNMVNITFQ